MCVARPYQHIYLIPAQRSSHCQLASQQTSVDQGDGSRDAYRRDRPGSHPLNLLQGWDKSRHTHYPQKREESTSSAQNTQKQSGWQLKEIDHASKPHAVSSQVNCEVSLSFQTHITQLTTQCKSLWRHSYTLLMICESCTSGVLRQTLYHWLVA